MSFLTLIDHFESQFPYNKHLPGYSKSAGHRAKIKKERDVPPKNQRISHGGRDSWTIMLSVCNYFTEGLIIHFVNVLCMYSVYIICLVNL